VAYGNGLFDAAIQIYEHFREEHRIDPAAEMALLRIAQSYTLMKRHKEAAQHYELFLKWYPRAEMRPLALLWSGRSHLFIGDTKVARERLAEVVAQFPQSAFADTARDDLKQLDARPPAPPGPVPATRTAPRDEQ
jgi:outer membrane protein assembly factor BamD (BamD/ComL family)